MSFPVVKGELCSCGCNFLNVRVENMGANDKFLGNDEKGSQEIEDSG